MSSLLRTIRFEYRKMGAGRALLIVLAILILVQPLLSYIQAQQLVRIGLDATPETSPSLDEPIESIPYLGFNALPFGEVVILVFAALIGARDYQTRELRTTLLAVNRRSTVLTAKYTSTALFFAAVSFASIYASIAATQFAVRDDGGLNPITLSSGTWRVILLTTFYWTTLGLIAYAISLASRSWLPAVLVLAPFAMGLGNAIVSRWSGGAYLPFGAGKCLAATPIKACSVSNASTAMALTFWLLLCVVAGWAIFARRDVGAR